MEVVRALGDCPSAGTAATIGAFDGVHLGHQALLRRVREEASARGLRTALVTFDRHPAQVVRPESAPKLLTTLDQKLELLAGTGLVDHTLVLTFDDSRRQEQAEEFVREVLVDCLGAQLVVVGVDFHFGNQRKGNVSLLEAMGAEHGFEVVGLPLVTAGSGPVYSSTVIRRLLEDGDVEAAATLLGRPHEVRGVVMEGDRRGRQLGFPTANVAVPDEICLPADGIYAGTFRGADLRDRPAAINLGRRPTFYAEGHRLLEAHLLDFDGDLYGQAPAVRFVARIRAELRFESADALIEAMHRDVDAVRAALG
ncbi:MAG: bifunctional riboflavin kinase/FAD synthetase [Acidimicrobiia bacterium]